MKNRRVKTQAAGVLATVLALCAFAGAFLLETAAATPGPPTYIPTDPPGDDGSWGPAEPDESASEQSGGQTQPPAQSSAAPPSQNSQSGTKTPVQTSSHSEPSSSSTPSADSSSLSSSGQEESAAQAQSASNEVQGSAVGQVVTVNSFSELKSALMGTAELIALGGDLTMEEMVALPEGRGVILDGRGFQISEGAAGRTIQPGDNSSVTLRNVTIEGYDVRGFVSAESGVDKEIVFDTVKYNGPQLCHNGASGESRVVIKDCDIALAARGNAVSEELVQGSWVEFEGNTSVAQDSARHPTFYLEFGSKKETAYGNCDRGIVVRKNARVSIEAADYMVFGAGGAFVMEEGSYFRYTAPDGGNHGTDNGFAYFDVGSEASFFLLQKGTNGHNKNRELTIAAGGVFKLGRGSIFEAVTNDTANGSAALDFRGDCEIRINAPRRMLVSGYNRAINAGGPKPDWTVNGINTLNYWDGDGGRFIWNDHTDGLASFGFKMSGDGALTSAPETVKDLRGLPLLQSPIQLYGTDMRQLTLGRFAGALAVESWDGSVSGFAATGAELTAAYYTDDGKELSAMSGAAEGDERSGGNSSYSVALPVGEAPAGAQLGIVASLDNLLVQRAESAERVEGGGTGEGTHINVNCVELADGRVETTFLVQDSAARGWRILASDPEGGETAFLTTNYRVGELNASKTVEMNEQAQLVQDLPQEESTLLQFEVLLPAKADGSLSPKTIRWTLTVPVD